MKEENSTPVKPDKNTFDRLFRQAKLFLSSKISIRTALIAPFTITIVATVGLIGLFSFRNGHQSVHELAIQLGAEISARTQEQLLSLIHI